MNKNINNYNEKEVKNKLKNFKEGSDYSVLHEGEKKIFNFHNNFLRDVFGNDYTTIYEVAESWDSDNFNHARAAAEYENDKTHITYRYEHKYNKNSGDYYNEWSWGGNFEDKKHTWTLRSWPNPNFDNNFLAPIDEAENHRRNLEEFRNERQMLEKDIENLRLHEGNDYEAKQKIIKFKKRIGEINQKNRYHEDWLAKNANQPKDILPRIICATCNKMIDQNQGHYICKEHEEHHCSRECAEKWYKCHMKWVPGEKNDEKLVGCCDCGFKEIGLSDKYCQECGAELCDEAKKPAKSDKSDLAKENKELKQQLSEVQKQLAEILEELKKLRNNSTVQNNVELDQQIDYNEKIIHNVKEVPEAEIKEQVQKSQALLKGSVDNTTVSPNKGKENGVGSLPYVIGGSVILAMAGVIGYLLVKKNKRK